MFAILPALALVQPYNLRGEDINVTIGPHPGGFPHHVENVTYDCRSEIELCRELFDAVRWATAPRWRGDRRGPSKYLIRDVP